MFTAIEISFFLLSIEQHVDTHKSKSDRNQYHRYKPVWCCLSLHTQTHKYT